jgi:hypothetical protein
MIEWRNRVVDCYGPPRGRTYAPGEMDANYREMTDEQRLRLSRVYGIDYAIVPAQTPTRQSIECQIDGLKLLRMRQE